MDKKDYDEIYRYTFIRFKSDLRIFKLDSNSTKSIMDYYKKQLEKELSVFYKFPKIDKYTIQKNMIYFNDKYLKKIEDVLSKMKYIENLKTKIFSYNINDFKFKEKYEDVFNYVDKNYSIFRLIDKYDFVPNKFIKQMEDIIRLNTYDKVKKTDNLAYVDDAIPNTIKDAIRSVE